MWASVSLSTRERDVLRTMLQRTRTHAGLSPSVHSDRGWHNVGGAAPTFAKALQFQFHTDMSSGGYWAQMSVACAATPLLLKNSFAQLPQ
jgi:hypothetical protein